MGVSIDVDNASELPLQTRLALDAAAKIRLRRIDNIGDWLQNIMILLTRAHTQNRIHCPK